MRTSLSLLGLLATASALVAQQAYLPPDAATQGLGSSANYWRANPSVHQGIYDSSHFGAQGLLVPVVINNLEWRAQTAALTPAISWPSVDIWLGYSATDYATPDLTFANNRSASHTLVYSGPVNAVAASGGTPNDFVINLPLTTPFTFDPGLGQDLLIEIQINSAPTPATNLATDCPYDVAIYRAQAVRSPTSISPTGALSRWAPTVRFGYTPVANAAFHEPYGAGCGRAATSFYEQFPGTFPVSSNDLTGYTINMIPNGVGYAVFASPGATVVPPTTPGLGLPDDGPSGPLTLPFAFPYVGGNSTSTVYAHSNGSVTLNAPGPQYFNNGGSVLELLNATQHSIAVSMQDLLCDGATNVQNVFAEPDPTNPTGCYLITWWDVPPFLTVPNPAAGLTRMQAALFSDGRVELRYHALFNESDSYTGAAITGFSLGGAATDPGNADLTTQVINTAYPEFEALSLSASPRPVLGQQVSYTLGNIRPTAQLSLMLASFVQANPGIPLNSLGLQAPGCDALISPAASFQFGPYLFGAQASFTATWPVGPYQGVQFFVQGFSLDPAINQTGVASSNGLRIVLDNN